MSKKTDLSFIFSCMENKYIYGKKKKRMQLIQRWNMYSGKYSNLIIIIWLAPKFNKAIFKIIHVICCDQDVEDKFLIVT